MNPVVVSFFAGPGYAAHADALRASCDLWGLEHDIREVPDLGSWAAMCRAKPAHIRDMVAGAHAGREVLWVDADARIVDDPRAVEDPGEWDVGILRWPARGRGGAGWAPGTVAVRPTPGAFRFLDRWADLCEVAPEGQSDKDVVGQALMEAAPLVWDLPPALCYVHDLSRELWPEVSPVVLHLQASRKLARGRRT